MGHCRGLATIGVDNMKKFILFLIVTSFFIGSAFAGEIRTTPKYIVLTEPTTNQVELVTATFRFDEVNPRVDITFNILSDGKIVETKTIAIQNTLDDLQTPEDESTTELTDFVTGYWSTLKSNIDSAAWQYITSNYATQDTP